MVMFGTKWPSMTSTWMRSAPAASASRTCSPRRVKSAARIDGANGLRLVRHIVVPLSFPVLLSSIIFSINGTLKVFDSILALTNGGPGTSTTNLPFYLYQQVNYAFDVGGAAAAGVVTIILTIIVATFALRMFARVFQFEEAGA